MPRPICANGRMPAPPARKPTVITSPHAPGFEPCPRCSEPKPLSRPGECFACESHDRTERARIARERALATYGEGRC